MQNTRFQIIIINSESINLFVIVFIVIIISIQVYICKYTLYIISTKYVHVHLYMHSSYINDSLKTQFRHCFHYTFNDNNHFGWSRFRKRFIGRRVAIVDRYVTCTFFINFDILCTIPWVESASLLPIVSSMRRGREGRMERCP